jgi:predicted permease
LTLRVELPEERYGDADARLTFFNRLLDGIRHGLPPNLGTATLANGLVEDMEASISPLVPEGTSPDEAEDVIFLVRRVAPGYFQALDIPILQGRGFDEGDGVGNEDVVVINENVARRFFPTVDPIGQRIRLREDSYRVVGVSGAIRLPSLAQSRIGEHQLFFPFRQEAGTGITIIVRVSGERSDAVEAVRQVLRRVDPSVPILDIALVEDLLSESLSQERSNALLMALFAITALVLGSIGIYGVVAYSVSRQIKEIGIRLALGASKKTVVGRVVLGSMKTVGLGLILGIGGASFLGRTVADLLHEVDPRDPWVFFIVFSGITFMSLLSTWFPARRAAGPNPILSLKSE